MKGKIDFLFEGYPGIFCLFHLFRTMAAGMSMFKVENRKRQA